MRVGCLYRRLEFNVGWVDVTHTFLCFYGPEELPLSGTISGESVNYSGESVNFWPCEGL